MIFEGIFFYVGFSAAQHGSAQQMTGTAEQFQYILRDESMHAELPNIDMINQIRSRPPVDRCVHQG